MELCATLKRNLESLRNAQETLGARILQTSKSYQEIVQEIQETAENLVNLIRRNEKVLVSKAEGFSQLVLHEFEEKKEAVDLQITEIESILSYHKEIESWIEEDTILNVDDEEDWKEAIVSKMTKLCTIHGELKTMNNEIVEFKKLITDPEIVDVFCNYGDIRTSYAIKEKKCPNDLKTCNLIDFDVGANFVKQNHQISYEETDSSYEAIPYL